MVLRRAVRREKPFELTAKAIREVEFRERVRGYDPAHVDPFLDELADQVTALEDELAALRSSEVAPDVDSRADADVSTLAAFLHVRAAHTEAMRIIAEARRQAREIEHDARVERRRARTV